MSFAAWSFLLALALWPLLLGVELSDPHALYIAQVLLARSEQRPELLLTFYAPLPSIMLFPWPAPQVPPMLAAVALGALALRLFQDLKGPARIALLLPLSPLGFSLAAWDLGEAVCLFLLYEAWRNYARWMRSKEDVFSGVMAGVTLGLSVFAAPASFLIALAFPLGAGFFRRCGLAERFGIGLVLLFPTLAGAASWAYLAWLLTGRIDLARPYAQAALDWGLVLPALPVYLLGGLLLLPLGLGRLLMYFSPLPVLWVLDLSGYGFSAPFALLLLVLFSIAGARPSLSIRRQAVWVLLLLAVWPALQLIYPAKQSNAVSEVSQILAKLPDRQVVFLGKDPLLFQLLAHMGTARPVLLPERTSFRSGAGQAKYALVCPPKSPPRGYRAVWVVESCLLYAYPPLPSWFPAQPPDTRDDSPF